MAPISIRAEARVLALVTAFLAAAGWLLEPEPAAASIVVCASNAEGGTSSYLAGDGEVQRLRVGYDEATDELRMSETGSNPLEFTCEASTRFELFTAALGDRADSVRLTGAGPDHEALPPRFDATLRGDQGDDLLVGHDGDNTAGGNGGRDVLKMLGGPDLLRGNRGNDLINGGLGHDFLRGGRNSDRVVAADNRVDAVNCGPGFDEALVDPNDRVRRCEDVQID